MTPTVQWPGIAVSSNGSDLLAPTRTILEGLKLLQTEEDSKAGTSLRRTPQSLQVITAGATAATKVASSIAATLGGGAGIWAALKAFWLTTDETQRIAYTIAAALIISATVASVAVIVRGDVQARSVAHAAQYDARARVASTFISSTQPAAPARYFAKRRTQPGWIEVKEFLWDETRSAVVVQVENDRVMCSDLEGMVRMVVADQ